ncbi:MAG: HlyD family type I secretion periplasmic adaptor subunit [Micropepsaceae bacterium]
MQPAKSSPRRPNWPNKIASLPSNTSRAMVFGFALIGVMVGGFGIWGSTVPIASAIVANGQVVVASKRKQIQHPTGGAVRSINVEEGQFVKEGAVLVELENGDALERFTRGRDSYYLALATEARMQAEIADLTEPKFSQTLLDAAAKNQAIQNLLDGQRQLFTARQLELHGQLSMIEQQHEQLKNELSALEADRRAARQQIDLSQKELLVVDDLYKKGYTTRTRVFSLNRDISQLSGNSERTTAMIARTRASLLESELKLLQAKNQIKATVQGDLRDVQAKIPNLREQFHAAEDAYDRMTIRAPVSGVVLSAKLTTVGSVVRPGETIMEIVPHDDRLMVEVQIHPADVDSVTIGLPTEVRFTGLSQRKFPALNGRVAYISADSLQDPRTSATYFVAHVDVPDSELHRLGTQAVQPGMPAAVMIKTGERTAIAYLTQPLRESINRAWRE